ncbi:MAG: AAA family ATPase [Clostridia bacterium]
MKTLFILRGLPGSGKTTLANTIVSLHKDAVAYAADDYFMDNGEYKFDAKKLNEAHLSCKNHVAKAMYSGVSAIIVHNTNTTEEELKPYFDMAKVHGYMVHSLIVENRSNTSNVHGVNDTIIDKMESRFNIKLR